MTSTVDRPILFLDVDGPLIPFGSSEGRLRAAVPDSPTSFDHGNPLLDRLDPGVGPRLLTLGCPLVWATTWLEDANEAVAPRLGLPTLPVVEWPDSGADDVPRGLHWKTRPLVEWSDGRPFIWVDDEIGATDRVWVAAQHPGASLLHRVDPTKGLVDADFSALAAWLDAVGAG
ncbi:HAD domain-containing protein [Streptomyces sp. NPDC006655]|uniref:HAD domain-containing protein n=1 Tax=Streptomyces sp. NPDC006655 TaxID=3156898 RepID=UPI0034562265